MAAPSALEIFGVPRVQDYIAPSIVSQELATLREGAADASRSTLSLHLSQQQQFRCTLVKSALSCGSQIFPMLFDTSL